MKKIEMYATAICPYCIAAKSLLQRKGISDIDVIRIDTDPARRHEMVERSGGRRTVPQIFIGGVHVGGHDDMVALDRSGGLDPMLAALRA
jgi:glutaredoxin 3